jgi:SAM-dependent methyltransferase
VIPDALWHDLECSAYREDLPLWRALADDAGGPVLDVGAGTGRVALDLAARGVAVVALDADPSLLATLAHRAAGLPVTTVAADARDFSLGRRFPLVIVPMQTLQLLGGADGRRAFLRRTLHHLRPGGLVAAALADAMACFDEDHDVPPPSDWCEIDGVRYSSRLLSVTEDGGRAVIRRRREITGPGPRRTAQEVLVALDRVGVDEVAAEAAALGFREESRLLVPATDEYLGSTALLLRAP